MHPYLVDILGFQLPAFGVMVALAFSIGIFWILRRAQHQGQNPEHYLEASTWLILAAILGARSFYFIFFPEFFWRDPVGAILNPGGLVWYGGVIGALAAIGGYTWFRKIPLLQFTDILSLPAAMGLAIGRIGCLLAGCCYGSFCNLPWAIRYPANHPTHGMSVHPAPLYETLGMLAILFLLSRLEARTPQRGALTAGFFILYGILRFSLEYLRGDRLVWLPGLDLSASQVISLVGILLGLGLWLYAQGQSSKSRSGSFSGS